MKLVRPVPMWQQVADHLRDQILSGTYQSGQPLPSEEALAAEFGVSRPTIREGIKTLEAEGLVEVSRPRGTIVRDPFGQPTRVEEHTGLSVLNDDGWTESGEPVFYRANATADQAALLRIPAGEPLLVRAAAQESDGMRRLGRLHMPFSVAEQTPWAEDPRLPLASRIYEHFTGEGYELTWDEHVRTRMPIADEAATMDVLPGVPLLIVLRVTLAVKGRSGAPVAVTLDELRHRGDRVGLGYHIQ